MGSSDVAGSAHWQERNVLGAMVSPKRGQAANRGRDDGHGDHTLTICHVVSGLGSIVKTGHTTHTAGGRQNNILAFEYTEKHGSHPFSGRVDASWIATSSL